MKPKDVLEQLIGKATEFDEHDMLFFTFYNPEKYPSNAVNVDFTNGTVEIISEDGETVAHKFAIKAELVIAE